MSQPLSTEDKCLFRYQVFLFSEKLHKNAQQIQSLKFYTFSRVLPEQLMFWTIFPQYYTQTHIFLVQS